MCYDFVATVKKSCPCRTNYIEFVQRFLLYCPKYSVYRYSRLDSLRQKYICVLNLPSSELLNVQNCKIVKLINLI